MIRPPEAFIHGVDGPVVVVPGRVASVLLRTTTLGRYAAERRSDDPEVDAVLVALRVAAMAWRAQAGGSGSGPSLSVIDGGGASSGQLTTAQAAQRLGIAERSVRRAIQAGRLPATLLGSRWVLDPEDVEHYRARRAA